jgi:3-oxoadipate enol-lactonase/4-carboxymuconolactone decarboxylase
MFVQLGDIAVHAQVAGPASAPAVLLLNSLSTDLHMWDPQVEVLARHHRVIRMDMRGHGLTGVTAGPYDMALLARDARALLEALGVRRAHVGGCSIGGRIAMQLAMDAPDRVASLMLVDTALQFGTPDIWQQRMATARAGGMAPLADATIARWVRDPSLASSRALKRMVLTTDPEGYAGACAALSDCRAEQVIGKLNLPTLIVVGEHDQGTPVAAAEAIRDAIPGSKLHVLSEAAHIPNFERAAALNALMLAHLEPLTRPADPVQAGLDVRRAILGEAHVARSEAAVTPFDAPFRDFILEGVWGRVWTRPGLAHRDRSLLCLGVLAALGHHEEFRLHVRATANTGVTKEEIAEVLVQVAAYGGVPAANSAFRIAKDTLAEMEKP